MFKPQLFGGEKVPAEEVCKVASQKGRVAPLKNPGHTKNAGPWNMGLTGFKIWPYMAHGYHFGAIHSSNSQGGKNLDQWKFVLGCKIDPKGEEEGSKYNIFQLFGTIETSCNRWPPDLWFGTCSIPIKCFMHKSTYLFTSFTSQQHPAVWHASHIPYIANAWLLISIG